mmetsp:Transcript_77441/g.160933  ORF Transcript_77441/g.160933 Transcript_77441/m.160933 type:complete len:362 (-) Transcript_77441:29-1114(-)
MRAAVAACRANARAPSELVCLLLNLASQLSCWRQDDQGGGPDTILQDFEESRQQEGQGLAAASFGDADDVPACSGYGPGVGLNRRRALESGALQALDDGIRESLRRLFEGEDGRWDLLSAGTEDVHFCCLSSCLRFSIVLVGQGGGTAPKGLGLVLGHVANRVLLPPSVPLALTIAAVVSVVASTIAATVEPSTTISSSHRFAAGVVHATHVIATRHAPSGSATVEAPILIKTPLVEAASVGVVLASAPIAAVASTLLAHTTARPLLGRLAVSTARLRLRVGRRLTERVVACICGLTVLLLLLRWWLLLLLLRLLLLLTAAHLSSVGVITHAPRSTLGVSWALHHFSSRFGGVLQHHGVGR